MAESEGFEPPEGCPSTVFKTAAFDHSATSPACGHHPGAQRPPHYGTVMRPAPDRPGKPLNRNPNNPIFPNNRTRRALDFPARGGILAHSEGSSPI